MYDWPKGTTSRDVKNLTQTEMFPLDFDQNYYFMIKKNPYKTETCGCIMLLAICILTGQSILCINKILETNEQRI